MIKEGKEQDKEFDMKSPSLERNLRFECSISCEEGRSHSLKGSIYGMPSYSFDVMACSLASPKLIPCCTTLAPISLHRLTFVIGAPKGITTVTGMFILPPW